MVKRNLFRYSSVLMCVVLTAASLVGCGSKTAATTGTDTAYVTEMAAGSTEAAITQAITNELAVSNKSTDFFYIIKCKWCISVQNKNRLSQK